MSNLPKILIAVSDKDICALLVRQAKMLDYEEIITARTGIDALRKAVHENPGHIIIGQWMPGMNGWRTTKAIRRTEVRMGRQAAVILGVTAQTIPSQHALALEAGCNTFATLPIVTSNDLDAALRLAVEARDNRLSAVA